MHIYHRYVRLRLQLIYNCHFSIDLRNDYLIGMPLHRKVHITITQSHHMLKIHLNLRNHYECLIKHATYYENT